jgi:hypothetical protein
LSVPAGTELIFGQKVELAGSGSVEVQGTLDVPAGYITGAASAFLPAGDLGIKVFGINAVVKQAKAPGADYDVLIGKVVGSVLRFDAPSKNQYIVLKKNSLEINADVTTNIAADHTVTLFKAFAVTIKSGKKLAIAADHTWEVGAQGIWEIETAGDLDLKGTLDVQGGGLVNVRGDLAMVSGAVLKVAAKAANPSVKAGLVDIYGKLSAGGTGNDSKGGKLELDGKVRVFSTGEFDFSYPADGSYLKGEIHVRGIINDKAGGGTLWAVDTLNGQIHLYAGSDPLFDNALSDLLALFQITGEGSMTLLSQARADGDDDAAIFYIPSSNTVKVKNTNPAAGSTAKDVLDKIKDTGSQTPNSGLLSDNTLKKGFYKGDFHYINDKAVNGLTIGVWEN